MYRNVHLCLSLFRAKELLEEFNRTFSDFPSALPTGFTADLQEEKEIENIPKFVSFAPASEVSHEDRNGHDEHGDSLAVSSQNSPTSEHQRVINTPPIEDSDTVLLEPSDLSIGNESFHLSFGCQEFTWPEQKHTQGASEYLTDAVSADFAFDFTAVDSTSENSSCPNVLPYTSSYGTSLEELPLGLNWFDENSPFLSDPLCS